MEKGGDEAPMRIKDVPEEARPRERLRQLGPEALSDVELIAILLRTGTRGESVLRLAERILGTAGNLRALLGMGVEELSAIRGVGMAKAVQLQAAFELGRRLSRALPKARVIRSAGDVAQVMMDRMRYLKQEHFAVLFLNTKNELIGDKTVFVGTLDASLVHPREVFREAVRKSAQSIVLVHNHPSGDPTPSQEDRRVTARLVRAGRIMGIDVLDHVIIGDGDYVSLMALGLMNAEDH
ncbi:MAG: DNA repair protein RadC [Hydrogenibacillus sp.]|nr:DNA repair protein RadC [Hydrogenibacillus sp.]